MPNYSWVCQCGEKVEVQSKITNRDIAPILECKKCGSDINWTRAHCESTSVDTHFPGAHRLEYNKHGLRKGY